MALLLGLGLIVSSCTSLSQGSGDWRSAKVAPMASEDQSCLEFFEEMQRQSQTSGYVDARRTVPGFPYLRSDRFLASFSDEVEGREGFEEWVYRLSESADTSIVYERDLSSYLNNEAYHRCREELIEIDLATHEGREALRHAVRVPSAYSDWKRVVGIYPVTRLFMAFGYNRWKENYLKEVATMAADPVKNVNGVNYAPAPYDVPVAYPGEDLSYSEACINKGVGCGRETVKRISALEISRELSLEREVSALGIPYMSEHLFNRLAFTYAPVFSIASDADYDRIGKLEIKSHGNDQMRVTINTEEPLVSVRFGYARYQGHVLPQISYTVWFRERPKEGPLDLIGGDLDAIMWRVTIGLDGTPIVYDTAHACGCYHLFFPVPPTTRKPMPQDDDLREEALVPMSAPIVNEDERLVVQISSKDHYVIGLDVETEAWTSEVTLYDMKGPAYFHGQLLGQDIIHHVLAVDGDEDRLQSVYGKNGIVAQSARLERLLLWPSGIASPGAMRAWGHQATAFVGKRHFDDPYLLEEAFE